MSLLMSTYGYTIGKGQMALGDHSLPTFSVRRIIGQTFLAFNLLLVLAVYNAANPQNSTPANNNAPSMMIRDFE